MNNKENEIVKYSNLNNVYNNAIKYLGDNVNIKLSTRKNKKFMVLNPNTNKWVHFGEMQYLDFTKTQNEMKRNNYLSRALRIKGEWKNNKYSPNNLSINILWN